MKEFLLLLCVLLSYTVLTNAAAGEDLEKAIATVNKAKITLDKVNQIILKANPGKIFAQVSKVLAFLGPAMMVVSAVMSIVAVFLPHEDSAELQALNAGFDKVNKKLDIITSDIRDLKNIVELSSAKSAYTRCVTSIETNFEVLQGAQKENTKASHEYFAKHYEMTYDLAAANLYDAMTGKLGPFGFNLVNLYKDYVKCNPLLVSKFCTMGMQTLSKGLTVEGAYFGTQNLTTKAKNKQEAWEKKLETLGESCGTVIKHCEDNWKISATQHFRESYQKELVDNNENFAQRIATALDAVVPQRAWLAVSYDDASGFQEHAYSTFYDKDEIWNENKKDFSLFSAPQEETSDSSLKSLKAKVDTQLSKVANPANCAQLDWMPQDVQKFGSSDLRTVNNFIREAVTYGVIYSIRLDKNPGFASTGNTLYSTDFHWKCTSHSYRLLAFI